MNKTLPIEIINKILIMRPKHILAKIFEEDENVKLWKKYLTDWESQKLYILMKVQNLLIIVYSIIR